MTALWAAKLGVALAKTAIKAAGPVLAGDRELSPRGNAVTALLAPVLSAALVVTETLGGEGRSAFDAKAAGCLSRPWRPCCGPRCSWSSPRPRLPPR